MDQFPDESRTCESNGPTLGSTGSETHPTTKVFLGPQGLRPFWGMLLFLCFEGGLSYALYPIVKSIFHTPSVADGLIVPSSIYVFEGTGLACVALSTWLMSLIERRPVSAYGFNRERALRNFGGGAFWGVVLLSLLVGALRAGGFLIFDGVQLAPGAIFRFGAIWYFGFLLVALVEESLTRGYLQFTLTRGLSALFRRFGAAKADALGFWTAAILLSVGFSFGHRSNSGESPLGLFSAFLAGLLFCLSLWRTGSLWWAIGFHSTWDWAQSFLYGVADSGLVTESRLYATHPAGKVLLSGGLTGPEGSVFMLVAMGLGAGIVILTLPRRHGGYTRSASCAPLH